MLPDGELKHGHRAAPHLHAVLRRVCVALLRSVDARLLHARYAHRGAPGPQLARTASVPQRRPAHLYPRLEDECRDDQDGRSEGQHAEGERLEPLEHDGDEVAAAARHGARLVEGGLDDVHHADEDEQRERERLQQVGEAMLEGVGAQVDGEDHQTPDGERQLAREDVVDEREDDDEQHPPEDDDALPADAGDQVLVVRPRDAVHHRLAQQAKALGGRRPAAAARTPQLAEEEDDHGDGGEEREDERRKEDGQRDDALLEELRCEQEDDEEGDDVDADEHDHRVLPAL